MLYYVEFVPLRPETLYDQEDCNSFVLKLTIRGSLSIDNSAEISLLIRTMIKGGMNRIILNLEHLAYIDSTGIGTIIQAKKLVLLEKGDLVLLNIPPKVAEVFNLVNLSDFLKSFYSDDKALENFKNV